MKGREKESLIMYGLYNRWGLDNWAKWGYLRGGNLVRDRGLEEVRTPFWNRVGGEVQGTPIQGERRKGGRLILDGGGKVTGAAKCSAGGDSTPQKGLEELE